MNSSTLRELLTKGPVLQGSLKNDQAMNNSERNFYIRSKPEHSPIPYFKLGSISCSKCH